MNPSKNPLTLFWKNLATLGPVGYLPMAPGTWGSLVAAVLAPWLFIPFSLWVKLLILGAIFILGALACSVAERELGRKDPSQAIIDEVLGQWVVFLFLSTAQIPILVLGFFLFRLFDVLKPWPVRASEKWLPGGYSVMIDDLLAGIYALLSLVLLEHLVLRPYLPALF